jgi:hypothetical protein
MAIPVVGAIPGVPVVQDERAIRHTSIEPITVGRPRLTTRRPTLEPHPTRTTRRIVPRRDTQGTIAAIGVIIAIAASPPAISTIGIVTIIGIATAVVPHHHDIRLAATKNSTTRTPHQTQDDQTNDASAHTGISSSRSTVTTQPPCSSKSHQNTHFTVKTSRLSDDSLALSSDTPTSPCA